MTRFGLTCEGEISDTWTGESWPERPANEPKLIMPATVGGLERVAQVMAQWNERTAA